MTLTLGEACIEKNKMVRRQLEKNDWKLALIGWASQGLCIVEIDLSYLNGAGLIDGAISN